MRDPIMRATADLLARYGEDPDMDEVAATVGIRRDQLRSYFTSVSAIESAIVHDLALRCRPCHDALAVPRTRRRRTSSPVPPITAAGPWTSRVGLGS